MQQRRRVWGWSLLVGLLSLVGSGSVSGFDTEPALVVVDTLSGEEATYTRQAGRCTGASGVSTAVYYDRLRVSNDGPAPAEIQVTTSALGAAESCGGQDTFLSVYIERVAEFPGRPLPLE